MALTELSEVVGVHATMLRDLLPSHVFTIDPPEGSWTAASGDDLIWLAAGEPVEVLVGYSSGQVVVAAPCVRWCSQTPVICVATSESRAIDAGLERWLSERVPVMRERRMATFVSCERCRRTTPPEWMLDDGLCQGCAQDDGVVF